MFKTIELNDHHVIAIEGRKIIFYSYGVGPLIPIIYNKSYVFKLNKKSISTCSVEMLFEYLNRDKETARKLFNAVSYGNDITNIKPVTIPAFYALFNGDLDGLVNFFKGCGPATRQTILADHICYNHDAKMAGVISMSTYVGENIFCQARCKNCENAICKYCYADSLTAMRAGLKNKLRRLHAIITAVKLSIEDIPVLDPDEYKYFRFESFGDLNNVIQVNNYNLIAAVNPEINFTLWTKNPGIVQQAINNGLIQAANLVIGLSSLYLNTPAIETARRYSFIRFLFTVYDDKYIEEHDININCGARHCITCGVCYKALHEHKTGDLFIINERKK